MNIIALIIQLFSGALGGNVAFALLKKLSLGTVGNSIVGGLGGEILGMLGMGGGGAGGGSTWEASSAASHPAAWAVAF